MKYSHKLKNNILSFDYIGETKGRSMEPFINKRDTLFVKKVKLIDIHIGDIVVFKQKSNYIGHRVLYIHDHVIKTKGDNMMWYDKQLSYKAIIGKVIRIEGKYGIIMLTSKLSRILSYYFLFYSYTTYIIPQLAHRFIVKILRGRKFLTVLIAHH